MITAYRRDERTSRDARIIRAVSIEGTVEVLAIAERFGMSGASAHSVMSRLAGAGLLRRVAPGRYEVKR